MTTADIQTLIDQTAEPRIEIGGPTPEGYVFLDKLGLRLPAPILVTNVANPITLNPYGKATQYPVDAVVDIRTLAYEADSIGLLLTSSLPLYGGHDTENKQAALDEYEDGAAMAADILQLHNLHIVLFRQTLRSLRPGGLLIVENTRPQDTPFARRHGLAPLVSDETELRLYSQIYRKP